MPFKSKAQQRKFFAMEARGELPEGTARTWAHHTKNLAKLPERANGEKSAATAVIEAARRDARRRFRG